MKKFFIIGVAVCLLSLMENSAYAKEGPEWFRLRDGEFEIPSEIQKASTISEVQTFLNSEVQFTRMAAAKRLGELGDREGIGLLVERFAKEPYGVGMSPGGASLVKLEIIRALGKIGGEEAKDSLLNIFSTYRKRGPKSKRHVWYDGDYTSVVSATLETLYRWRNEREIFDLFKSVYLEERKIPDCYTRLKAYELYLRAKMEKEGVISIEQSAKYLSRRLTGTGAGRKEDWVRPGVNSLEALRNMAIMVILESLGEPGLPYLEKELKNIPSGPSNTRRREALNDVIKNIHRKIAEEEKQRDSRE